MVHFADLNNKSQEMLEDLDVDDSLVIEDLDVDNGMIEDQNGRNLLRNGPLEPCIGLEFDEVEDARTCYTTL
jgi:hypothetical protein